MVIKIKNNMQYGVPKDGIVNVTKELSDDFLGTFDDKKGKTPNIVRVKKRNCVIIEK